MADHNATSIQSLSIITQSATAYQQLNAQLVSTVTSVGYPFLEHEETLSSTVDTSDAYSTITTELLTSSVLMTDTPTFEVDILLESTVTALESLQGTEWTTTISPSSFEATEELIYETSVLLADSVKVWDTFVELSRDAELKSTIAAIDTIYPGLIYNQLEVSTVHAQDIISLGKEEFLVDNIIARDVLSHVLTAAEMLASTANAVDETITWALQTEELGSSALTNESFSFEGSIYNEMLTDTANVIDTIWAKDFGAVAWTMNTKSGALTNYSNYGFNSMAFHGGKLYATSPEGLFEMGADDDDGRQIDAHTLSGFDNYGTDRKKRVSDIYVGYTGGELECDVEARGGPEAVYTYPMEYREADAPRNSRLKIGRGLSSKHWRLAFRNVGGADFQIYDVSVQVATSKRRL